jgi:hypothetical protein
VSWEHIGVPGAHENGHDDENATVPETVDEHGRQQVARARVAEPQHHDVAAQVEIGSKV